MTDLEILAELKDLILALPAGDIKRPSVPIVVSIYEGERTVIRAEKDVGDLLTVNCTADRIEHLKKLTCCARIANASHAEIEGDIELLQKTWIEVDYPDACKKKDDLLAMCDLAFFDDVTLNAKVDEIKEGNSIMDTLDDLTQLSVLGPANADKFAAYNLPIEPFVEAGVLAVELTRKRAVIDGDTYLDSDSKVLRDKAITLMEREVRYIRRCGKFVYRDNPDKAKHYASAYQRNKKAKNNSSDTSNED